MQQTFFTPFFQLTINSQKQELQYHWIGQIFCNLKTNSSDEQHGNNLEITALEHKIIHELTHYYVAIAHGYSFCPIVHSQVLGLEMPINASYFEEIVFSMVYFSLEKKMLYGNWWSYLDRLHGKANVFELMETILHKFNLVKTGMRVIPL